MEDNTPMQTFLGVIILMGAIIFMFAYLTPP